MDRNLYYGDDLTFSDGSLSARRAWIEMRVNEDRYGQQYVALRKESVDRNLELSPWGGWGAWSLSARRAWIEIDKVPYQREIDQSLSARRAWIEIFNAYGAQRSD